MAAKRPASIALHSAEAEEAVIGALLMGGSSDTVNTVFELLTPADFFVERLRYTFTAAKGLHDDGDRVDFVTVTDRLRDEGTYEDAGGGAYLVELISKAVSVANAVRHSRIVYEKSVKRRVYETLQSVMEDAQAEAVDAFALIDDAQAKITELGDKVRIGGDIQKIATIAAASTGIYEERIDRAKLGIPAGILTGLLELDKILGGLRPAEYVLLAARPSMGKTGLLLSLALKIARGSTEGMDKIPVGIFSLEMSAQSLYDRLVAADAGVNSFGILTGSLSDADWRLAFTSCLKLGRLPVLIDDSSSISYAEFRGRARRMVRDHGVKVIFVDYLQLMTGVNEKSREQEVAAISRTLKAVAKELGITIVALGQLNRSVETRMDKKPVLSDLRESGSLEQDADVVIFVHRPEYYGLTIDADGNSTEGIAELIIAKHRNGPTGTARVAFLKERAAFDNLITVAVEKLPPPVWTPF